MRTSSSSHIHLLLCSFSLTHQVSFTELHPSNYPMDHISTQDNSIVIDIAESLVAPVDGAAATPLSPSHLIDLLKSKQLSAEYASELRHLLEQLAPSGQASSSTTTAPTTGLPNIAEDEVLEASTYDPTSDTDPPILITPTPAISNDAPITKSTTPSRAPYLNRTASRSLASLAASLRSFLLTPSIGTRHMSVQEFVECLTIKQDLISKATILEMDTYRWTTGVRHMFVVLKIKQGRKVSWLRIDRRAVDEGSIKFVFRGMSGPARDTVSSKYITNSSFAVIQY